MPEQGEGVDRYVYFRSRAVSSISIFMHGSARPAQIMVAAGRTSPQYRRSAARRGV
jgi:hypothetical protein